MKKFLHSILFCCLLLASIAGRAQTNNALEYVFTGQYVSNYAPLADPTILWSANFDDYISDEIAIPSVTIGGNQYNTMRVSCNGNIQFSTGSNYYSGWQPMLNWSNEVPCIIPFGMDLIGSTPEATVGYVIEGSLIMVEWKNIRRFAAVNESFSFQTVINAQLGSIQFIYGPVSNPGSSLSSPGVGLTAGTVNSMPNVLNRSVTTSNSWATSVGGTDPSNTCRFSSYETLTIPDVALTYEWQIGTAGCMDPTACNYNADAIGDDGSCDYCSCGQTCGCTDPAACNFNPEATLNDGSCYSSVSIQASPDQVICNGDSVFLQSYPTNGMAPYTYSWTSDDGLFTTTASYGFPYPTVNTAYTLLVTDANGCTGSAVTFVEVMNCISGCMDTNACNFDPNANVDFGSCDYSCFGCTDIEAMNYDSEATIDNGSCYYNGDGNTCSNPISLFCSEGLYSGMTVGVANDNSTSGSNICGGLSNSGQRWYVYTAEFDSEITISTINALTNFDTYLKVFTGSCGNFSCVTFNDDMPGTNFQSQCIFDAVAGTTYFIRVGGFATQQGTFGLSINCGGGCLDPAACNYDVNAPFDDGSCTYGADCYGCTDPEANNYSPVAVYNQGCQYNPSILVYYDLNGDGAHQFNEPGLANWPVYIPAMSATIFSNAEGYIDVSLPASSFSVELINDGADWVSTSSSSVSISVPSNMDAEFGLIPASGETFFVAGPYDGFWDIIHCTDGYEAGVFINNTGDVSLNGTLTMTCDESFIPEQDSYLTIAPDQVAAGFAQWNIADFTAGADGLFSFHIDGPGTDNIGVTYPFTFNLVLTDANGNEIYNESWTTTPWVACSYDPNDLTATPEGYAAPHFILPGQRLQFRVRFQNTGNLPAEDIIVMDQLDPQVFNISTFAPLYGSDQYNACLHDDGTIDFIFSDIYLMDSATDEEASHGFVVYEVDARNDIVPGTVLLNQANIFFDANPAIITNETHHTIFDCSSFTGINGDLDVCSGEPVQADATQDYVESYSWFVNGEMIGEEPTHSFDNLAIGTYNISVVTANPLCEMIHENVVIVNELPTVNAGPDVEICEGNSVVLNATSDTEVIWTGNVENNSEVSPVSTTTYVATATNAAGCQSIDEANVIVHALPAMEISQNGSLLTAADGIAWQWYHDGLPITGGTTQVLNTSGGGEYYVVITGEGDCTTTSATVIVLAVEESVADRIILYPNPMTENTTVILPQGIHEVVLFDMSGRQVMHLSNCMGRITLSKNGLSSGIYQLRVQNEQWTNTTELIVE